MWRELAIVSLAVAIVVTVAYSLAHSWFVVALVFASGLGLGAVWLIVRAIHAVVGRTGD
jgi:uncharacterized membrane protein